jgi:capsular polysaccharide biosynthesis protein
VTSSLTAAIRRSLPLLAIAAVLPASLLLLRTGTPPPTYTSTASVYVATTARGDTRALNAGAIYVQRQMSSYTVLAKSSDVLDTVIADFGLEGNATRLGRRLKVSVTSPGHIIDISSVSSSADIGTALVGAVARSLTARIVATSPRNSRGLATVTADVLGPSVSRVDPQRPWRQAILTALAGLALSGSLVLYRYAAVDRIKTIDDIGEITTAKVLAKITAHQRRGSSRAVHSSITHETERLAVAVRNAADGGAIVLADTTVGHYAVDVGHRLVHEMSTAGVDGAIIQHAPPLGWLAHSDTDTMTLPTRADVEVYVENQQSAGNFTAIIRTSPGSRFATAPALGATHGVVMVNLGRTSSASLVSVLQSLEKDQINIIGLVVSRSPPVWSRFPALGRVLAAPVRDAGPTQTQPTTELSGDSQCRS